MSLRVRSASVSSTSSMLVPVLLAGMLLAGCASGPKLSEVQAGMGPVPANQGRVWFYRSSSPLGFAIRPAIRMDGVTVGESVPGGFFWVDRASGPKVVTTETETDYSVKFVLEPGQERFVRTVVRPGILVGRVAPELVDPAEAREELASKSHTPPK